jgi:hypothetical protein
MKQIAIASVAMILSVSNLSAQAYDESLFDALEWRNIGPYRGGRVVAVAGVVDQPYVYYMGATGGGVWKTVDGGAIWEPVTDDYLEAGSVGAIAVAPSDPNVVYVGMGEACIRGNTSPGDGMYVSMDAGKTWKRAGLRDAGQIGGVVVHPNNADIVYVAVLGHAFGPNEMRGVFRSKETRGSCTRRSGRRGACPGGWRAAVRAVVCSSQPTAATAGPRSAATTAFRRACWAESA